MIKRNKVANMDNEVSIKVDAHENETTTSDSSNKSKKIGSKKTAKVGKLKEQTSSSSNNDTNISEHQLNDLVRSSSKIEKWTQPREVDYLFAARLVKDARDLRNLTFKKTEHNLKSYERYLDLKMTIVLYATVFVHLMLPLIEEPAVWETPYWVPCCIELVCLCVYTLRWINARSFQTSESFRVDKKNFIVIIIIILIFLDIVAFIAVSAAQVGFRHRFTRPLRVLIYINFNEGKELRRAIRNVRKTLPDIFNVFALFFLSLFMFAFVGWNLLRGRPGTNASLLVYSNNQSYFQYFEDSIWDLYISVTTANFPDVMMPAYDINGAYAIFFISFMLINLYIFINIILATIYTNYKKHLKEEVRQSLELKRNKIKDAFDLIKFPLKNLPEFVDFKTTDYIRNEYEYVINYEIFTKLMKHVNEKSSDKQLNILYNLLDVDGNRLLAFKEFVFLPDLLNIRLTELKDRQVIFEQLIPGIYNSKPSKILKNLVRHKIFQMFFDLLILINMIFVFLQFSEDIEWFFLIAYLIEIFLKIYECGLIKFVNDYWNVFDSLIVFSGIIAGLVDEITGASESKSGGAGIFEIVLILRSLRLIKFVASVHRFRTIITTIAIITPSLITYAMLLLTIFYIFSMIGMEIFGTTIKTQQFVDKDTYTCYNPRLKDTDFVRFKYCKNNFSSFPNSLVLLFELMVVNQWHVLSRGFEDAMGSKWTRIYFFAFHISCVIISLNIFTAFVIEAFLLEYENSDQLTLDSTLETRIKTLGLNFESEPNESSEAESKNKGFGQVKQFLKSIGDIIKVDDDETAAAAAAAAAAASARRDTASENKSSLATQGVRFHINSKEPKSVDVLLQRMFSHEFDISQDDLLIVNNTNNNNQKD